MRSLLALVLCASAFGFVNIGLERVQDAVAGAFAAEFRELQNFNPVEVASRYELQASPSVPCQMAWGALAASLTFNASDPCTHIPLAFQNFQNTNWTDAVFAYTLENYCNATNDMCRVRYATLWEQMVGACTGFNPGDGAAVLQNKTDQVARTIRALINVPCLNISGTFSANATVHPTFGFPIPATVYQWVPCLIDFVHLIRVDIDTVQQAQLPGICTDCARDVYNWLNTYGVNQLAFAARQALSYCHRRRASAVATDWTWCVIQVQLLRRASAAPDFQTKLTAGDPTALAVMCDPCAAWGLQLAKDVVVALKKYNPSAVTDAMVSQLSQSAAGLAVACDKDGDTPCAVKLAKYNTTYLLTAFSSCLSNSGCTSKSATDPCRLAILAIYRDVQCCIRTFIKGLALSQSPTIANQVSLVLASCGYTQAVLPPTCSRKRIHVMAPLKNVLHAWVQNHTAMLPAWFAATLGIDVAQIAAFWCWEADTTLHTSACNLTIYPASTGDADTWCQDFNDSRTTGDLTIVELNSADITGPDSNSTPFADSTQAPYDTADFTASSETACIQALSPVNETLNATTGTCVGICMDGMMDGDESDVDCGGTGCARCLTGQMCNMDNDCVTGDKCQGKKCVVPHSSAATLIASPLVFLLAGLLAFL